MKVLEVKSHDRSCSVVCVCVSRLKDKRVCMCMEVYLCACVRVSLCLKPLFCACVSRSLISLLTTCIWKAECWCVYNLSFLEVKTLVPPHASVGRRPVWLLLPHAYVCVFSLFLTPMFVLLQDSVPMASPAFLLSLFVSIQVLPQIGHVTLTLVSTLTRSETHETFLYFSSLFLSFSLVRSTVVVRRKWGWVIEIKVMCI